MNNIKELVAKRKQSFCSGFFVGLVVAGVLCLLLGAVIKYEKKQLDVCSERGYSQARCRGIVN